MITAKILLTAFVITWASWTVGCPDVKNTSTGGGAEQPVVVQPAVVTPEAVE